MVSRSYKLELDPPKRNIFVTQLQERDEEVEDTIPYPVVRENAGKLIETGINTLQKTLLLKKEVEVDIVNRELVDKRAEFKRRMEACAEKQIEVQKKQQKMKDQVSKFEKFIQENEGKRRRAIQKYQQEVKLRHQKNQELDDLERDLAQLRRRHKYLENLLHQYKKFEEYLMRVVDNLPENYIEMQDTMINSLMLRHNTLFTTNQGLVADLTVRSDELEAYRQKYETMIVEHDKMKMSINSTLANLQKELERKMNKNERLEQIINRDKAELRELKALVGMIFISINNIAEKCRRISDKPLEDMLLEEKLEKIRIHVCEQIDIANLAQPRDSSAGTGGKRSAGRRRTKVKNTGKVAFAQDY